MAGAEKTLEEKINEQMRRYDGDVEDPERAHYEVYADALKTMLEKTCEERGIHAFVQSRAKDTASFAGKITRKGEELDDPVTQFTDLCGARVITQTQDEVEEICRFIRQHFRIDEDNSPDIRSRLEVGEFGYLSSHLVVQMPWAALRDGGETMRGGNDSEEETFLRTGLEEIDASRGKPPGWAEERIGDRKAEIQVRTLLQHAWAAVTHDRVYKGEFDPPARLQRQLHRMAALLEEADGELQEAVEGVDSYNLHYAAYLEPGQIIEEMERWEIVLDHAKGDKAETLALKIARLAAALEDWEKVVATLQPYADADRADIPRDLGLARVKMNDSNGQSDLERAVELNPEDVDALCYLGDTYCRHADTYLGGEPDTECIDCCEEACDYYARAFRAAPAEPHALRCYLECTLCQDMDIGALKLLRPGLEAAIETCRKRAEVGVYLPYAYYDIGIFELVLDRPYESLSALAKGVHHSGTPRKIEAALSGVTRLQSSARRALQQEADREDLEQWLRRSGWVRRFLLLARAAKLREPADSLEIKRADEKSAEEDIADTPHLNEARATANRARSELKDALSTRGAGRFAEPLVIVAGGTAPGVEPRVDQYRRLITEAFTGFEGTIICGGTTAGISGIIGGLETAGHIRKVAYLADRKRLPDDAVVEGAYQILEPVQGETDVDLYPPQGQVEFTALEPIQAWIDILCSGIHPGRVSVLGINGGQIAAFEYRLALAMGATVGVIQSSGRAADRMREEVDEWRAGSLLWLPADKMSLRAFVQPPWEPHGPFDDPEVLDRAARHVHEDYCESKRGSADPALKPWDDLDRIYKDSNRRQIMGAERILRTEDYELRPVEEGGKSVIEFGNEEVERMAEKEHGRFVAARLRDGWRYGPERDKERRLSPYLCAWEDVPDPIREYDRDAVRGWPDVMAEVGLKIVEQER